MKNDTQTLVQNYKRIIKIWTNNSNNQKCKGFLNPYEKLDYVIIHIIVKIKK